MSKETQPCWRAKKETHLAVTWMCYGRGLRGEALSMADKNWISGDISFPRDDENKDKFLLSAEDECHGTHSSFKKETYIS